MSAKTNILKDVSVKAGAFLFIGKMQNSISEGVRVRVIVLYQNKGVHTGKFTKTRDMVLTGGMFSGINSKRMVYEKWQIRRQKRR